MYASQLGFLDAKPKDQPETRFEQMKRLGETDFGLPELHPSEYMLDLFKSLGPVRRSGETLVPTDWPVIAAFGSATDLESDDMLILNRMCRSYFYTYQASENPLAIPPTERKEED